MRLNFLEEYLSKVAKDDGLENLHLPLYHTYPLKIVREYIKRKEIFPLPCDVFKNEEIIYLFLGKAEYKDNYASNFKLDIPIGFALNSITLASKIKRIYPFDTGAVKKKKLKQIADITPKEFKSAFLMGDKIEQAYALIKIIFGDVINYIETDTLDKSKVKIVYTVGEIEKIIKLYESLLGGDDRKSTIEIQIVESIKLNVENVLTVFVTPKTLTNFPELDGLIKETNIPPYHFPDWGRKTFLDWEKSNTGIYEDIRSESRYFSKDICKQN